MSKPIKIDIAGILKKRAPNTKVPKFIVEYLKKIVHEEEINQFFVDHPDIKNLEFMEAAFEFLQIKTIVEGEENLPDGEKYIFVCNHPLGGMDGVATGFLLGKRYNGKIRFFSNDLLSNLEPLKEMFIPVNKFGSQVRGNAHLMSELYESDNHLLTFPAGMVSRKIKGEIVDLEWKKNFILKSIQYQRDIIPIYFEGRNSEFFYNLAKIRKFLRIKFNVEMMFLADEMFKQRGKTYTIRIGKPIQWESFDKSKTPQQWATHIKQIVYSMRK